MKNLIAELLIRLAQKEVESKELMVQVEALEVVVTALLRKLDGEQLQQITDSISSAMATAAEACPYNAADSSQLNAYIQRLLVYPRS
ncbi:anti-adapter protein IraP [Erwinia mallotivora]|uniref:Anti-RssB factor n=1 Tax=Erwinia mallotivora TaxID=69222 RepID=A0A014Q1L8_9GAMM|nr:anti-adapter protein IraP [Erwinia mallotivora]EXU77072.1 anti-RssB factor [Erwinia mallotivora]